jgi:ABC-type bacteriocin/lantibiotic exporter with double-glycine peptidase domain
MKSYFKIVKMMFASNKRLLLGAFVVMMALITVEMAIPMGINAMIDMLETDKAVQTFVIAILFFIIGYFLLSVLSAINTKLYIRIGNDLLWNMREKIYKVIWGSEYMDNVQKSKDRFKYVLSGQTYTVFAIAVIYSVGGFVNALTVIAFLLIAFWYSIPAGITLVLGIAFTLGTSFITGRGILGNYELCDEAHEKDTAQVYETVDMVEATRTNGLEEYYLKKNKKIHDSFMKLSEKAEGKSTFFETIENSLNDLIYILVAGMLLLTSNVSGGKLVTVLFLTNTILAVSGRVQRQIQVIIKNIPAFDNVVELMDIPIKTGKEISDIESIRFDNVSLDIDDRKIMDSISFAINKGDNVLIRGENGSGKSSILKMILGLYKPTSGNVSINDTYVSEYDSSSFYKEICYVSQDELILNESVEDYLRSVTHSDCSNDKIKDMRQKLKLNPEIETIEENGATLSGGEKKKLFMMKCMMESDASLVILDEIDAGLDNETKALLKNIEKELLDDQEKMVIKISHIDSDVTGFDQVVNL